MRHTIKYTDVFKIIKRKDKELSSLEEKRISDKEIEKYFSSDAIEDIKSDEDYERIERRLKKSGFFELLTGVLREGYINTVIICEQLSRKRVKTKKITITVLAILSYIAFIVGVWKMTEYNVTIGYRQEGDKIITSSKHDYITNDSYNYTYIETDIDFDDIEIIEDTIKNNIGGPSVGLLVLKGDKSKSPDELADKGVRKAIDNLKISDTMAILVYLGENQEYRLSVNREANKEFKFISIPNSDSSSDYSDASEISILAQFLYRDIINADDSLGETYNNLVHYIQNSVNIEDVKEYCINTEISSSIVVTILATLTILFIAFCMILLRYPEDIIREHEVTSKEYKKAVGIVKDFERYIKYKTKEKEALNSNEKHLEKSIEYEYISLDDIQFRLSNMFKDCETNKNLTSQVFNRLVRISEKLDNKEVSDESLKEDIDSFLIKYGNLIVSTATKIKESKDKEKSDKLAVNVSIILENILNKHEKYVDNSVELDLDTMEHLMVLDGYGDTHGIKMCTHE